MNDTPQLTYQLNPSKPTLQLPANACDSHVHVFGPATRFPYAANRHFTPVDAGKETLFALHRHLGVSRCVIVQSLMHGFDNSVVADAIAHGGGRYLGVALAPLTVSDAQLATWAEQGFRALRFNFMDDANEVNEIVALSHRLQPLGMHLQVHFEASLIHQLAEPLAKSAVPVVIDHMGRVDAQLGEGHADFLVLQQTLKNPLFHVKLSGIDRVDPRSPHTAYAAGVALAKQLLADYPEQCLWGTDWPHPFHNHVPDDGVLLDALARIAPTEAALKQLLVHNPQQLYRFEA
jgi:2-pyrone-4,6-dicarboxylate lactonase